MADTRSASHAFAFRSAVVAVVGLLMATPIQLVAAPAMSQTLGDIAMMAPKTKRDAIFGSVEFERTGVHDLPQWQRVTRKLGGQLAALKRCVADESACENDRWAAWRQVMLQAKNMPVRDQLDVVNSYFNKWRYRKDSDIYADREYWATPLEFLANSGDCEDYAITKFATLLALGVPEDKMRIVVLFDRIRQLRHAVLAYYGESRTLVLDSLSDYIFEDTRYTHYLPEYSLTRENVWTHVPVGN